ncbi:UNVERIFIED_CONTAM: Phosphoglucomutase-3 [Siphonaria sp. JEL0065]|nr:Phosphoglucomutase-3 [Siphonaria sp. JEL0065]
MEAGFAGMNCLTVIQASQGLAEYILATVPNAKERGFVVGHDHRHNSETFAKLTAAVFLEYGFKVYYYTTLVHTPMVPFAIKHLRLSGGVMVTASHNPKQDNGYKVYWENSAQIIPPHDAGIAAQIKLLNNTAKTWDTNLINTHPNCIKDQTEALKDAYFATVAADLIATPREKLGATTLRYVYTPMHGVGHPFAERVVRVFGMPELVVVPEQVHPDPDFSTVAFPNPEEKGALDLAIRLADSKGVGLVLANDPDADRFAVAEKKRDGSGWHVFTGDQIGSLLGYALVLKVKGGSVENKRKVAMVNSAVSSKMLRSICLKEGHHYAETLTGFKWMSNHVVDLMKLGYDTFFAYEEAIGFMTHPCVLDKDGVTALASFVELAVLQQEKGSNMVELLEELYVRYGFHASDNYYFICHDPKVIAKIFHKIRFGGGDDSSSGIRRTNFKRLSDGAVLRYPLTVAGFPVVYIRDLTYGFEMSNIQEFVAKNGDGLVEIKEGENIPTLPVSSSSEMITFELANECVFTLRTSGTEPKIKYYIEKKGTDRDAVREDLKAVVRAVGAELFEATANGLNNKF